MSDTLTEMSDSLTEPRPKTNTVDLRGRWALCNAGRIGLIQDRKQLAWGLSWVGVGLDGQPWASRRPRLISDRDATLLEVRRK